MKHRSVFSLGRIINSARRSLRGPRIGGPGRGLRREGNEHCMMHSSREAENRGPEHPPGWCCEQMGIFYNLFGHCSPPFGATNWHVPSLVCHESSNSMVAQEKWDCLMRGKACSLLAATSLQALVPIRHLGGLPGAPETIHKLSDVLNLCRRSMFLWLGSCLKRFHRSFCRLRKDNDKAHWPSDVLCVQVLVGVLYHKGKVNSCNVTNVASCVARPCQWLVQQKRCFLDRQM